MIDRDSSISFLKYSAIKNEHVTSPKESGKQTSSMSVEVSTADHPIGNPPWNCCLSD